MAVRRCACCGEPLRATMRADARFCCKKCRVEANMRRQRGGIEARYGLGEDGRALPSPLGSPAGGVAHQGDATPPPPSGAGPGQDEDTWVGPMESTLRAKMRRANAGYEDDPVARYLLSLARMLDRPGDMRPTTMAGLGKEFREGSERWFAVNGAEDGDALDYVRTLVERKRSRIAEEFYATLG